MDDLFLIAHKVRGEPAFDIAIQMDCPKCTEAGEFFQRPDCSECDGAGHWWIVSTSGHRAHPFAYHNLDELELNGYPPTTVLGLFANETMPPDLPDHYPCNPTRSNPNSGKSLLAKLGLTPKVPRRL